MARFMVPFRKAARRYAVRCFALLIVCVIFISLLPLQTFAASNPAGSTYTMSENMNLNGDTVTFTFSSGYLTVDGCDEQFTKITLWDYSIYGGTNKGTALVDYEVWADESYRTWTFSEDFACTSAFYEWFEARSTLVETDSGDSGDTGDTGGTGDTGNTGDSVDTSGFESTIDPGDFNVIHYEDYIVDTVFDGTSDVVTVSFPAELVHTYAFTSDGVLLEDHVGSYSSTFTQADTRLLISLLGTNFTLDGTDGYSYSSVYPTGGNVIDLADFPEGTVVTFDIDIAYGGFFYGTSYLYDFALNDAFKPYFSSFTPTTFTKYDEYFNLNCNIDWSGSSDIRYGAYAVSLEEFNLGDYTLTVNSIRVTFTVDGLLSWYEETGKTNELLEEVIDKINGTNDRLDDTNDLLDDILNGGSAGDDLVNKGDQIGDSSAGLGGSISGIKDFEAKYFGDIDSGMDQVLSAFDVTVLAAPMIFVKGYVDSIMAGFPMQYALVFTLPIALGIFMYIVQHPIKAPRPDTSGDVVTRETFTETTILSGPHAGKTTSTRTVTHSAEIGREHSQ